MTEIIRFCLCLVFMFSLLSGPVVGQTKSRTVSGVLQTDKNEVVPGVTLTVSYASSEQTVVSDDEGRFSLFVPREVLTLKVEGKNITPFEKIIGPDDSAENLLIKVEFVIPPIHESVVISATTLDPVIDRRNDTVYKDTLFLRDDQLLQTLSAGINQGSNAWAVWFFTPKE